MKNILISGSEVALRSEWKRKHSFWLVNVVGKHDHAVSVGATQLEAAWLRDFAADFCHGRSH